MAMSGEIHTTTDHELIRKWTEQCNGQPVTVEGIGSVDDPSILRIQFPDYGKGKKLTKVSREDFFRKFEKERLALVYQDTSKDGQTSRFSKFVARNPDPAKEKQGHG